MINLAICAESKTARLQDYYSTLSPERKWPSLSQEPLSYWQLDSANYADQYSHASYDGSLLWHEHPHLNRSWTDHSPIVNITHN